MFLTQTENRIFKSAINAMRSKSSELIHSASLKLNTYLHV